MHVQFKVPCNANGVVLIWASHDEERQAIKSAMAVLGNKVHQHLRPTTEAETLNEFQFNHAREALLTKTREMNRQWNENIPYFRCSYRTFEDIYRRCT